MVTMFAVVLATALLFNEIPGEEPPPTPPPPQNPLTLPDNVFEQFWVEGYIRTVDAPNKSIVVAPLDRPHDQVCWVLTHTPIVTVDLAIDGTRLISLNRLHALSLTPPDLKVKALCQMVVKRKYTTEMRVWFVSVDNTNRPKIDPSR